MTITIIAAMSENRVIGRERATPWHLPADLVRFRKLTMGHTLIMGRKTFESIGHPLPGRNTIVLSRNPAYHPHGVSVAGDLKHAISLAQEEQELFICGGGEVYRQALPLADRILLTVIHRDFSGDTRFPALPSEFILVSQEEFPNPPLPHAFIVYEKDRR